MTEPSRFDAVASSWDGESRRVRLAQGVAEAIRRHVALSPDLEVLDFGCGTGLLSFELAPQVGRLTGADTSTGMLEVFRTKAEGFPGSVMARAIQPSGDLGGPYHLIVSSMTLHHVQDLPPLLRRFHASLRPGGRVALADLAPEGGAFHEDHGDVFHHGFAPETWTNLLGEAGFQEVTVHPATTVVKSGQSFEVLLALGRRAP